MRDLVGDLRLSSESEGVEDEQQKEALCIQ